MIVTPTYNARASDGVVPLHSPVPRSCTPQCLAETMPAIQVLKVAAKAAPKAKAGAKDKLPMKA